MSYLSDETYIILRAVAADSIEDTEQAIADRKTYPRSGATYDAGYEAITRRLNRARDVRRSVILLAPLMWPDVPNIGPRLIEDAREQVLERNGVVR
jgi:hypothetical protein